MYKTLYRVTKQVVSCNRILLLILIAAFVISQVLVLVVPYISKIQIEILEKKINFPAFFDSNTSFFLFIIFIIFLSNIFKRAIFSVKSIVSILAKGKFAISTDKIIFNKLSSLDVGMITDLRNNKLIYLFFDLSELPYNVLNFIITVLFTIITIFSLIPILLHFNGAKILGIIIFIELIRLIVLKVYVKKQSRFAIYAPAKIAKIKEIIFLFKYKMDRVIKASGEKEVFKKYVEGKKFKIDLDLEKIRLATYFDVVFSLLEHLSTFLIAIILGYSVLAGEITIGLFTMSVMYLKSIQANISLVSSFYKKWYSLKLKIIQLNFFLNLKSEKRDVLCKEFVIGDIAFDRVSFKYPRPKETEIRYLRELMAKIQVTRVKGKLLGKDSLYNYFDEILQKDKVEDRYVLNEVSDHFKTGVVHAIIGKNGAGKTTLVNLITRDYIVNNGSIKIHNKDIQEYDTLELRSQYSYLGEEDMIIKSVTVRENILLGSSSKIISDKLILETLLSVGLDFAIVMKEGFLDTVIGDDKIFSAGQMQLLSMSRVLLQDRPIIILDESTSRLDALGEQRVIDLLHSKKSNKIIIFITHRMTTAKKADLIHVINNEKIDYVGTHEKLINQKDCLYSEFWKKQIG